VIQEVADQGKLDNTLIVYIFGDNGTSSEGTLEGTFNQMTAYNSIFTLPEAVQMLHYEEWGSEKTYPHMSVAWSWAFDTPFKWTKAVASHFGATRQGMAISWPVTSTTERHSLPVPSRDRHCSDDPRSHRHPRAVYGRRHRAKAHRRREHGDALGAGVTSCRIPISLPNTSSCWLVKPVMLPRAWPDWRQTRHPRRSRRLP